MMRAPNIARGLVAALALTALGACAGLDDPDYFEPLPGAAIEPGAGPADPTGPRAALSAVLVGDLLLGGRVGERLVEGTVASPAAGPAPGAIEDGDAAIDRDARRAVAFERLSTVQRQRRRIEAEKALLFEHWVRARVEPAPMERADIQRAQQLLATLGYLEGPVDGLYGEQTRTAIERFEADLGLPVSGRVSPALVERLALEV